MTKKEREYKKALEEIAKMGFGLKEEIRDWQNIGRNAVMTARQAIAGKCKCCGKNKDYSP